MNGLQEGDKISIGGLRTVVEGFNTIGNDIMVCTPYGEFNITLVQKDYDKTRDLGI